MKRNVNFHDSDNKVIDSSNGDRDYKCMNECGGVVAATQDQDVKKKMSYK
jgi:hypothetical protein